MEPRPRSAVLEAALALAEGARIAGAPVVAIRVERPNVAAQPPGSEAPEVSASPPAALWRHPTGSGCGRLIASAITAASAHSAPAVNQAGS